MSNQQTVKSIGDIDRNLRVETSLDLPATDWRSAKCGAFQLYGLYQPLSEGVFRRMPEAIAAGTPAESGLPAVSAPEPALTSMESEWP